VRNRADFGSFLEAALQQCGWNALPLVRAAHREPERLGELDAWCDAFTNSHVANRASRLQGRALFASFERIFPSARPSAGLPAAGHFAPMFGVLFGRLGIDAQTTVRLYAFNFLRGLIAAAVRLNIVGPMEAQTIQFRLGPRVETICEQSAVRSLEDLTQTSPVMEFWQANHERLYSRLFQS
jgi:urease accessory protein